MPYRVSVVVPSFNRRDCLRRLLRSLADQSLPANEYEVIVCLDGSDDGSREMVEALNAPYELRLVSQLRQGRAAACNRGLQLSTGSVVVVLDDDMEPSRQLLAAHAGWHAEHDGTALMGAAPILAGSGASPTLRYVAAKFNRAQEALARPGWQISLRDFYTGNFSCARKLLLEVGGFDPEFRVYGHEDGDLALRLQRAGVALHFSVHALAYQHYTKDFAALARDNYEQGQTAVVLSRKHPGIVADMRLGWRASWRWRLLRQALLRLSAVPAVPRWVIAFMRWLERVRPAGMDRCYFLALDYFYWLGARQALSQRGFQRRATML